MTRTAISPRLAISTFFNGLLSGTARRLQRWAPPASDRSALDLNRTSPPSVPDVDTMRIAVLGTGPVGRAVAGRLAELGHEVVIGTRDPGETAGRDEYAAWAAGHADVRLG